MDDDLQLASPAYSTGSAAIVSDANTLAETDVAGSEAAASGTDAAPAGPFVSAEGDAEDRADGELATIVDLPQQVAYLPTPRPNGMSGGAAPEAVAPVLDGAAAAPVLAMAPTQEAPGAEVTPPGGELPPAEAGMGPSPTGTYLTEGEMPAPIAPKKKSFLASLFGASSANAAPAATRQKAAPLIQPSAPAAAVAARPLISQEKAEPLITLASAEPAPSSAARAALGEGSGLPGVRQTALFEIKRKSGIEDDSDVDLHEDEEAPLQVASAAGLARLAPNGLLKQTEGVDVACLKPSLLRVLKQVEQHYGRKVMITSGYRDPARNRRARGAKNSLHMYCAAVDVQISGVTKWDLASYVRTMPGRGGVGTYCHTESVHIDVGPERDWNWRCRRRR